LFVVGTKNYSHHEQNVGTQVVMRYLLFFLLVWQDRECVSRLRSGWVLI